MPRARNIKPGFFKNEELVELPALTRILFIGLWCLADREGRLEDRPKKIKMEILPADDCNVNAALDALHDRGFILRYAVDGVKYIAITGFAKHQNPHHKEVASVIPPPITQGKPGANPGQAQGKPGADPADSLIPRNPFLDSLIPDPSENNDGVSAPAAGHCTSEPDPADDHPKKRTASEGAEIKRIVDEYTQDERLREALYGWIKARKQIKKPPTARAVRLALASLERLAVGAAKQLAIVDQAVLHNWQTFYPLKDGDGGARASASQTSKADQFAALAERIEREGLSNDTG